MENLFLFIKTGRESAGMENSINLKRLLFLKKQ